MTYAGEKTRTETPVTDPTSIQPAGTAALAPAAMRDLTQPGQYRPASFSELLDVVVAMILNVQSMHSDEQGCEVEIDLAGRAGARMRGVTCWAALRSAHAACDVTLNLDHFDEQVLAHLLDDTALRERHRLIGTMRAAPDKSPVNCNLGP